MVGGAAEVGDVDGAEVAGAAVVGVVVVGTRLDGIGGAVGSGPGTDGGTGTST